MVSVGVHITPVSHCFRILSLSLYIYCLTIYIYTYIHSIPIHSEIGVFGIPMVQHGFLRGLDQSHKTAVHIHDTSDFSHIHSYEYVFD